MSAHPIRLTVSDELKRKRITVLLRLVLVIPHLLWMVIFGIPVFFATIANWLVALIRGRCALRTHNFVARYIRYVTHVYAYMSLAADPYPRFFANRGYPVDVQIDPPTRQARLTVLFRAILVVPASMFSAALSGSGTDLLRAGILSSGLGLLGTCTLLGWWVSLVRGRMPRGLRDGVCYSLGYSAQFWAYLMILTDRYPTSDPLLIGAEPPCIDHPVRLTVEDELRRSRLMVLFRAPLVLVHVVWLVLWGVLALGAAAINWLLTLILGRSPTVLHRFLAAFVRYQTHVVCFLYLVANPFPGFTGRPGSYPIEANVPAEPAAQSRWCTAFRLVLSVPAYLLAGAYASILATVALLGWFAALFTGRMPSGLRNAGALAVGYWLQSTAYLLLLTDRYPYSGPLAATDEAGSQQPPAISG
jgi:hypothetical protein